MSECKKLTREKVERLGTAISEVRMQARRLALSSNLGEQGDALVRLGIALDEADIAFGAVEARTSVDRRGRAT